MKDTIMIITISLMIGFFFQYVFGHNPVNFIIFGFAAFGMLITIKFIITLLIQTLINKKIIYNNYNKYV